MTQLVPANVTPPVRPGRLLDRKQGRRAGRPSRARRKRRRRRRADVAEQLDRCGLGLAGGDLGPVSMSADPRLRRPTGRRRAAAIASSSRSPSSSRSRTPSLARPRRPQHVDRTPPPPTPRVPPDRLRPDPSPESERRTLRPGSDGSGASAFRSASSGSECRWRASCPARRSPSRRDGENERARRVCGPAYAVGRLALAASRVDHASSSAFCVRSANALSASSR